MTRIDTQQLIAYLDGELTANQQRDLERALNDDSVARAELERLRDVRQGLKDHLALEQDPSFVASVLARTANPQRRTWSWRPLVSFAAAASVASVLWLVVPEAPSPNPGFQARGGATDSWKKKLGIEVFLHAADDPSPVRAVQPGDRYRNGDGLTFVAHNRTEEPAWLVIEVKSDDGERTVLYPREGTEPYPLSGKPAIQPLPDGVTFVEMPVGTMEVVVVMGRDKPPVGRWMEDPSEADPEALVVKRLRLRVAR